MSNHSVIEHRANYHFVKVEEDYIAICTNGETSPHCKAMILAVLESWANTKRDKGDNPYIYMTYEQWEYSLYHHYKRNVIICCLDELIKQELIIVHRIKVNGKWTYEYCLNCDAVQEKIKALPEKSPQEVLPRLNWDALKNQRVEKSTHPKINGTRVEKSTPPSTDDALKNQRILDSITKTNNLDSPKDAQNESPPKTTSRRGKRPPEEIVPIAPPACPDMDAVWNVATCLKLADYYRGYTKLSERKAKRAKDGVISLIQRGKTREQIVKTYRYMLCLDKQEDGTGIYDEWWDGKEVDIWNVSEHIDVKLREIERKEKTPQNGHSNGHKPPDVIIRNRRSFTGIASRQQTGAPS